MTQLTIALCEHMRSIEFYYILAMSTLQYMCATLASYDYRQAGVSCLGRESVKRQRALGYPGIRGVLSPLATLVKTLGNHGIGRRPSV